MSIIKLVIQMKEKNKDTSFGLFVFRTLSLIAIVICLIILLIWMKDNKANDSIQSELEYLVTTEEIENDKNEVVILNENILNEDGYIKETIDDNSNNLNINVDFDILSQKNPDTVGWVAFQNLNINYPIVQSKDNTFYLTHNFYKDKNSAGWIFGDAINNFNILDKNTIVYGHNRRNGTMFSKLNNYLNKDFCQDENNHTFLFATKQGTYKATIFSAYKVKAEGFTIKTNFESEISFFDYLKDLQQKSNYNFNNIVSPNDKIISLCTCDNNNKYRIVVHAKLKYIPEQ